MHGHSTVRVRPWGLVLLAWLSLSLALRADETQVPAQPRPTLAPQGANSRAPQRASTAQSPSMEPLFPAPPAPIVGESTAPVGDARPGARIVPNADRAGDLWLVSTRHLPKTDEAPVSPDFAPDVYRYVAGRGWVPSSLGELVRAENPVAATAIFVHGNDTSAEEAADDGEDLYARLRSSATTGAPPTRFVIWSWPIMKTNVRVRHSAQTNALRANLEGYFLAAFLCQLAPRTPVSIVGYSSGAGVVTGALHVLGGGTLEGRTLLSAVAPPSRPIQVVLLGAAMPNDWLMAGMPHERALSQAERMVVTVNADDAVLRWYAMLWGRAGAPALGATGLRDASRTGAAPAKVVQVNLQESLQRHHGWSYYIESPEVLSLLCQEMLRSSPVQIRQATRAARRER